MRIWASTDLQCKLFQIIIIWLVASGSAYAVIELDVDYNAVGNVVERTTPLGTTSYGYDLLDRLKTEDGPAGTETFIYDANGNRTSDGGGSLSYPPESNRLGARYGTSYTYNAAGNVTGDGTYTYVYNQRGQLKELKQGQTVLATYHYDYRNRRTRKVSGGTTTLYHYDQFDRLIGETTQAAAPMTTYLYGSGSEPVAQINHGSPDAITYLSATEVDAPRTGRDQSGTVVWRWESAAFGTTAPDEDPDGNQVLRTVNLRFPGQYYDGESGLFYNHHRYYNAATGRYLQSDPIGLQGGLNTYSYAGSNPLRFVDPKGLYFDPVAFCLLFPWAPGCSQSRGGICPAPGTEPLGSPLPLPVYNEPGDEPNPLDDYPSNPDDWEPPEGVYETDAKEITGGKHRHWKDASGKIVRRWDREGSSYQPDLGPHYADPRFPGRHILPNR